MLALEALPAKNGDCLLLYYGAPDAPHVVIIDGGPRGVFAKALQPRLKTLRNTLAPGQPLPVELAMISHIDDDHIAGIEALLKAIEKERAIGQPPLVRVGQLWHNSFQKIVAQPAPASTGQLIQQRLENANRSSRASAVTASVPQGMNVSKIAARLGIGRNGGQPLVTAGMTRGFLDGLSTSLEDGLILKVIAPQQHEIDELRKEWADALKTPVTELTTASRIDDRAANLSSIVAIARYGERSILLTGDALGANILTALADAGELDETGSAHFDVLKVPHHGSDYNVTPEFFKRITADHYLISGNGKYGNPEPATLQMLAAARGGADYTLWCTYRAGDPKDDDAKDLAKDLGDWVATQSTAGRPSTLKGPAVNGVSSIVINLDGELTI